MVTAEINTNKEDFLSLKKHNEAIPSPSEKANNAIAAERVEAS